MTLSASERVLIRLSTAIVLGRWEQVRRLRAEARPDRSWREAVLQTHLFAGFPRLVEAYGVLEECGGLGEPEPGELEGDAPDASRGRVLFERIYGDGATRVRAMLAAHHADYALFIEQHAYARVLARPGLAANRRELLACCALAALGQERQLASHARGSLRCGASSEELRSALESLVDLVEPARLERARRIAEKISAEGRSNAAGSST